MQATRHIKAQPAWNQKNLKANQKLITLLRKIAAHGRHFTIVTNKEICLVKIVFIYACGAVLFVRSATN